MSTTVTNLITCRDHPISISTSCCYRSSAAVINLITGGDHPSPSLYIPLLQLQTSNPDIDQSKPSLHQLPISSEAETIPAQFTTSYMHVHPSPCVTNLITTKPQVKFYSIILISSTSFQGTLCGGNCYPCRRQSVRQSH